MAFHEAQKWEAAQATLRGQAPCITLPRLLLTGGGGWRGLCPFRRYWSPRGDLPAFILPDGPAFGELATCLRISSTFGVVGAGSSTQVK